MINISELNSFPTQDGGSLALLKEHHRNTAQRNCRQKGNGSSGMAWE